MRNGVHRCSTARCRPARWSAYLAYLLMLQDQLKIVAGLYRSLQESGANVDRIMEVLGAGS